MLGAILAAGLVIAGLNALGADDGGSSEPEPPSDVEVRLQCEQWVDERLKSPSTAEHSGQTVTSRGEDSWEVHGVVDSQNGFGAMVRTPWSCVIRLEDDVWRGSASLYE